MAKGKLTTIEKAKLMNDILYSGKEFVIADIETSALSPNQGGMIIELAGVKVVNGKVVDTFSQLINPERKIYAQTTKITGITNDMLEGKPVYGQVLPEFYKFLGNAIFVAHNSIFDWDRFLLFFFQKVGIYPTNQVIDTLALAKLYYPEMSKHTLDEMCERLGIKMVNHHRALDDAMATSEMLITFKEKHATELINPINSQNLEQTDIFNFSRAMTNESESIESTSTTQEMEPEYSDHESYRVKRVKYWEKEVSRNKVFRRLYVTVAGGTAYLDIHTKTWYNKDLKGTVEFDRITRSALEFLGLKTIEDLCDFRN